MGLENFGILVKSTGAQMHHALLQVEHLMGKVNSNDGRVTLFNLHSEFVQFLLLALFELHLEESNLIFKVGQDNVVPLVS